jgi:hypothetical protein
VGGRRGIDGVMEIRFQEARAASAGMRVAIKLPLDGNCACVDSGLAFPR